jgi:hypothetical protein
MTTNETKQLENASRRTRRLARNREPAWNGVAGLVGLHTYYESVNQDLSACVGSSSDCGPGPNNSVDTVEKSFPDLLQLPSGNLENSGRAEVSMVRG